ncbi:hypothetical protein [Paenibacillus sp. SI8]|uniref:hypothetical protein n=1 Tax=unclassified Paenibacillus TaxID=185978 RepID=UPI0034669B4E
MKKSLQILTTSTLATVLLLSGAAASAGKASAAEASASKATLQAGSFASQLIQYRLSNLAQDAAFVSGKETSDIQSALANGNNLIQATNLTSKDILNGLTPIIYEDLYQAQSFGLITTDEFKAAEDEAAGQLSQVIDTNGYQATSKNSTAALAHIVINRLNNVIVDTASYGKKDTKDVLDDLHYGKSLVASAGSLDPGELQSKMLNALRQELQFQVTMNLASQADVNTYYALAADKLTNILNTPGYQPVVKKATPADLDKLVSSRISHIINDTAFYAHKDLRDVLDDLHQGKTLIASAASLDPGELSTKLLNSIKQELQFEVTLNRVTQADADKSYAAATAKISDIISTPGYQSEEDKPAPADLENLINSRIDRIISDSAFYADKDLQDVLDDLYQGKSLVASAASLDPGELNAKLLNSIKQDLQFEVSMNRATQADADKSYAEAAAKISNIISTPGYQPEKAQPAATDLEKLVSVRIDRIINDTAFYANKDVQDVLDDLHQGKTLVASAASLDAGELKDKMLNNVKQDLQFEVSMNHATQADADKYYAEAADKIASIIYTPGYSANN